MSSWVHALFYANLVAHGLLLAGVAWCVAYPERRIYPMERKNGAFYLMWLLFYFVFSSNFALVLLDWDTGTWRSSSRFFIGAPLALFGALLVTWGMTTLGAQKTSGIAVDRRVVTTGPYRFTRNPQYLGDMALFAGVVVMANSELALDTHALTCLVFVIGPLAEEPWLERQFGEVYVAYRRDVARFL